MPVQKTNLNTTWNINADNETWTLAKNAKITVVDQYGIDEGGFYGSDIRVLGDITATSDFLTAIHLTSNSSVFVGDDARINVKNALAAIDSTSNVDVVNRGHIEARDIAINGVGWGNIENYGTITATDNGIFFHDGGSQIYNYGNIKVGGAGIIVEAAGTYIQNAKGAEISGSDEAIRVDGSGESEVVNKGVISGGYHAISDQNGEMTVRNSGTIIGDIFLGMGADTIDTRKGVVKGEIEGGYGGDTYMISNAKTKIVEGGDDGAGTDEVRSTVTYKLAANVEELRLLRKKDINATGNELENTLGGNKGDNHLSGKAGEDFLNGGRGNDVLNGGTETDVFVFNRTDGKDVINDFEDGMDRLYIEGVYNQATFDELDIRQAMGDVIIDFGNGNRIRIEDLTKANFSFEDIILLA